MDGHTIAHLESPSKRSARPWWLDLFYGPGDPIWLQAGGIAIGLLMLGAIALLGWEAVRDFILVTPR